MHVLEKVELNSVLIHNARELVPQFDTLVQAVGANHVLILVGWTQQNICITAMVMELKVRQADRYKNKTSDGMPVLCQTIIRVNHSVTC